MSKKPDMSEIFDHTPAAKRAIRKAMKKAKEDQDTIIEEAERMKRAQNMKSASVTIGSNDYYYAFGSVFIATDRRPGVIQRLCTKFWFGWEVISEEERVKRVKRLEEEANNG